MFNKSKIDEETQLKALKIIRDAYSKLMSRQFFYYNIASQFALKAVDKSQCATMGVAHVNGLHWLVYNPEFIQYYDYTELVAILEHEICHFTYDHVKHFNSERDGRKIFKDEEEAKDYVRDNKEKAYVHRVQNIATDRSINVRLFGLPNIRMSIGDVKRDATDNKGVLLTDKYEKYIVEGFIKENIWFKDTSVELDKSNYIKSSELDVELYSKDLLNLINSFPDTTVLEANCITEQSFKDLLTESGYKGNVEDVKKYESWKYYFDLLMSCPKTEEAIKNIREMDVHFGDGDSDGEGGRDAQESRDRIMIEAAKNSKAKDIPGDLRERLRELFDKYSKEAALPWNVIFRRLVNSSKKSIKRNDVNSRNKYAPGTQILPGYILDPIKDIAVVWDASGSCMDEETQTRFITEVNMMIKAGSNVRVYYTDAAVEHIQDCKGKPMRPAEYKITGGGGTDLDTGITAAIKDGYRIVIMLTDCWYQYQLTKKDLKGRKIITVSTTESKSEAHYGPTIHINQ